MLRPILLITALFFSYQISFSQRAATLKAGLLGLDHHRDGKTTMLMGYFGGLDVRLGSYDNSYVIIGVALCRLHSEVKTNYEVNESLFKVVNGIDLARIKAGIEGRFIKRPNRFNLRWSATVAFNALLQELGEEVTDFEGVSFNLPIGLGIDVGHVSFDFTFEPGLSNWIIDMDDTHPRVISGSIGLTF